MLVFTLIFSFIIPVLSCQKDYILRNAICCKTIVCPQNYFVVPCDSNLGYDKCRKCPEGYHLPDNTTSNFIVECFPPICPEDTIKTDIKSHDGCSLYCKCNVADGYCGLDPCACIKPLYSCGYRMKRTQNCGCDPVDVPTSEIDNPVLNYTYAEQQHSTREREKKTSTIDGNSETSPQMSLISSTVTSKQTTTNNYVNRIKTTSIENSPLLISISVILSLLICMIGMGLILNYIRRKKKRRQKEGKNSIKHDRTETCVQYYNDNRSVSVHHHNEINRCSEVVVGDNALLINNAHKNNLPPMETSDEESEHNENDIEQNSDGDFQGFNNPDTQPKQYR